MSQIYRLVTTTEDTIEGSLVDAIVAALSVADRCRLVRPIVVLNDAGLRAEVLDNEVLSCTDPKASQEALRRWRENA